MSLPKINVPTYKVIIPSSKKEITIRGWTVKEEKILLLAKETNEIKEIVHSMVQIVNNCIVDKKFNIDTLTLLDIKFLFLYIRSKSVGAKIPMVFTDPEDNQEYPIMIDLEKIKIETSNISNKIILDEAQKIGIIMKHPNYKTSIEFMLNEKELSDIDAFKIIKKCIESVFDAKTVYKIANETDEEIDEFLESIPAEQFQKIEKFFESEPKLKYEIIYGNNKKYIIEDIKDFF
jgi:hypothetical protein